VHRHADLFLVRALGARAEVADARPLRLRRRDPERLGAVAPSDHRVAATVALLPARRLDPRLRGHGRGRARHHDQPLPLLLAGFAGGRGQPSSAERGGAARPSRIRHRAPVPDQAGHDRRHGVLEHHRPVHRRRHGGDAQPARHHQHPDLGAGRRGASAGRRRVPPRTGSRFPRCRFESAPGRTRLRTR